MKKEYLDNDKLFEAINNLIKPLINSELKEDEFREKCIELVMEKMWENYRTAEILIDLAYAKEWLYVTETDHDFTFWIFRNKPFTKEEYENYILCILQWERTEKSPYELQLTFWKHMPIHKILKCLDDFWKQLEK